jgi:hypothetical protein
MKKYNEFPETIDAAVTVLRAMLTDLDIESIENLSRDQLISLHFGLGGWIRNNFGLWEAGSALLQLTGATNPDDASMKIIEALWQKLQDCQPRLH